MAAIFDCAACGATAAVTRAHRGRTLPCPSCGAPIDVPGTFDFRANLRDNLADRKSGYRAVAVAWISAILCFLPIPVVAAAVWWWASRRIHRARDEGREVPEPLLAARTIAAVGCLSQVVTWAPWALRQVV